MTLEERNKKVEENTDLIYEVLHSMKVGFDEDCFQQGCLALIRCVELFDESKGYKFSTYAYTSIRGAVLNYLKRDNTIKPITVDGKKVYADVMSLDYEYGNTASDVDSFTILDVVGDTDVVMDDMIVESYYEKGIKTKRFTKEESEMFRKFLDGYSNDELCKMFNVDKRKLQSIKRKVKDGLKTVITSDNLTYNVYEGSESY